MLDDLAIVLTQSQQTVLAAWFAKTGIVLTLARPVPDPDPRASGREDARVSLCAMLTTRRPPQDMILRVAHMAPTAPRTTQSFVPPSWATIKPYAFNAIVTLTHFLFEQQIGVRAPVAQFVDATKHDDRFLTIWPRATTSVTWPPPITLNIEDANRLRDEWRHTPEAMTPNAIRFLVDPAQPLGDPAQDPHSERPS